MTYQVSNQQKGEKHQNIALPISYVDLLARRAMDLSLSLIGMILLSPVFLLIAVMIKRDSPGPIFYRGLRAGKNNRNFLILKFRTMYEEKKSYQGPKITSKGDPRVTAFGRWLRATKMNELPQLWNVFLGEMSLVGPRPEDPKIVATWPSNIRQELLAVRPGITSPASVVYRNEEELLKAESLMDKYLREILPPKLRLDLLYVRNRSLFTDIDVLFWTLISLVPRLKNYSIPTNLLVWGPLTRLVDRYISWFLIDIIISFSAVGVAGVIWRLSAPLDLGIGLAISIAFFIALLFSLFNTLIGVNRITWSQARSGDAFDLAISSGFSTLLLFLFNLVYRDKPFLPPGMLIVAGLFSFFGFVVARYRSRLLTGLALRWFHLRGHRASMIGERMLIIGTGEEGQFAFTLFKSSGFSQAFSIIGMVDNDPRKIGMRTDGCVVMGVIHDIPHLVRQYDVGLILYALPETRENEQQQILSLCNSTPARTVIISDILDTLRAHFPIGEVERRRWHLKVLRNSTIDRLTEMYNRNQFFELTKRELPRAQRYGHSISLILLRIDYDRPEDSTYMPTIGAQALCLAAKCCYKNLRRIDIPARLSQNELVILLPETDLEKARIVASRLKGLIANQPVATEFGTALLVLKLGVASSMNCTNNIEALIKTAHMSMGSG